MFTDFQSEQIRERDGGRERASSGEIKLANKIGFHFLNIVLHKKFLLVD